MILVKTIAFIGVFVIILAVTLGFIPLYLDDDDDTRLSNTEIIVTKASFDVKKELKIVGKDDFSLNRLYTIKTKATLYKRSVDIKVSNAFIINNTYIYDIFMKGNRMTRDDKNEIQNYRQKVREKVERLLKRKKRWDNFHLRKREADGFFVTDVTLSVNEKLRLLNTSYDIMKDLSPEDDFTQIEYLVSTQLSKKDMYNQLYIDVNTWVKWNQPIIKVVEIISTPITTTEAITTTTTSYSTSTIIDTKIEFPTTTTEAITTTTTSYSTSTIIDTKIEFPTTATTSYSMSTSNTTSSVSNISDIKSEYSSAYSTVSSSVSIVEPESISYNFSIVINTTDIFTNSSTSFNITLKDIEIDILHRDEEA